MNRLNDMDTRLFEHLRAETWRPEDAHEDDDEPIDHVGQFKAMLGHELGWCHTFHASAECNEQSIIRWALSIGATYEANSVVSRVGYLRFEYAGKAVALAVTEAAVAEARRAS